MPHWGIVTSPVTVSLWAEVFNHVNRNKDVTCLDVENYLDRGRTVV